MRAPIIAPAAVKAGHIHGFRIQADPRRAQAGQGFKLAIAGHVDLDQQVFSVLGHHRGSPL
jgi:hypothetical protein